MAVVIIFSLHFRPIVVKRGAEAIHPDYPVDLGSAVEAADPAKVQSCVHEAPANKTVNLLSG